MALISISAGLILQFLTLTIDKMVNSRPQGISFFPNLIYLLLARPVYVIGFTLFFIPLVLQTQITKPLRKFLSSRYWIPFSKLTYGVFLCNSVFI